MFALVITVDMSTIPMCLFPFTCKAVRANTVWDSLTMKKKLFTTSTDRCDILSKLNNCSKATKELAKE